MAFLFFRLGAGKFHPEIPEQFLREVGAGVFHPEMKKKVSRKIKYIFSKKKLEAGAGNCARWPQYSLLFMLF